VRRRSAWRGVASAASVWADLADDLDPVDASFIARLVPPTPSAYHRLNPLTKAVIATVGSIGAFVLGGYVGPIAIGVAMLLGARAAGVASCAPSRESSAESSRSRSRSCS
jgi:hypothetical protein